MVFKGHPNELINDNANICSVMRRSGRFHLRRVIKFSMRPWMSRNIIIVSWHDALGRICSIKDIGARVKWIAGIVSFRKRKPSKQNWRGGSFGKTLAAQSWRYEFDPQHAMKSQAQLCVSAVPVLGRQRQGIPGETPDAEVVLWPLHTCTQEQAHNQSIRLCTTVWSSAHRRSWAFLLPHRPQNFILEWSLWPTHTIENTPTHGSCKESWNPKEMCGYSLDVLGRKLGKVRSWPR